MQKIIQILHEGNYACVVENYNEIYTFSKRGVADLYDIVKSKPCFLKEALIADKVVGKGAAALMIIGGVGEVYADVISLSALILLRNSGIEPEFARLVPFIWNTDQTDCCPLERICYNETSAEAILPYIDEFIVNMRKKQKLKTTYIIE